MQVYVVNKKDEEYVDFKLLLAHPTVRNGIVSVDFYSGWYEFFVSNNNSRWNPMIEDVKPPDFFHPLCVAICKSRRNALLLWRHLLLALTNDARTRDTILPLLK